MLPEPAAEFGPCRCGGRFEARLVEVRFRTHTPPTVLSDVAQGRCRRCDTRAYQAGILEMLERAFRRPADQSPDG